MPIGWFLDHRDRFGCHRFGTQIVCVSHFVIRLVVRAFGCDALASLFGRIGPRAVVHTLWPTGRVCQGSWVQYRDPLTWICTRAAWGISTHPQPILGGWWWPHSGWLTSSKLLVSHKKRSPLLLLLLLLLSLERGERGRKVALLCGVLVDDDRLD